MSRGGNTILNVDRLSAHHTTKDGILKAVNDVSFIIRKGEAVGLLGESGAGKTSIAMAILGIFERLSRYYASSAANEENKRLWKLRDKARKKGKTAEEMGIELPGVEGHIWFNDIDLLSLSEKDHRTLLGSRITYVPQGVGKSLNPRLSIEQQTLEVLWAHFRDTVTNDEDTAKRVLDSLGLVELGDMAIRQQMIPSDFSRGEDQRVLLAMALISKPDLVITDEPTTAIDHSVRHRILNAINLARKELGLSVLMISNDVGPIAETCDRIGIMASGRIMEFGDSSQILNEPLHPFTQAFMMSNPTMEMLRKMREKGELLKRIPGRPPSLINFPPGCPFNSRCAKAETRCFETTPEYREIESEHWVFCHVL